jgi:SAM-dependent methyltransferase
VKGAGWRPPATCPACGALLRGWRLVAAGEPGGAPVPLLRCIACGTAVTAAPAPVAAHDSGAYATDEPRLARAAAPVLAAFDRRRLALLRDTVPPPARLLDAGAGRGRFVAAARAAGYDAEGLEPSRRGVRAARERHGILLLDGAIDTADLQPRSFDAVTLWHVLEHLDDPGAALERLTGWLRPGGVLLVGVPNRASLQARLTGGRWFHLDAPRHRTHFTAHGLELLLRGHGLEPLHSTHVLAEHNPFGLWQSLVPTRTPAFGYHLLKRNARADPADLAITAAAVPLAPLAAAVELAAGLARRGGTIAVVARAGRAPRRPASESAARPTR